MGDARLLGNRCVTCLNLIRLSRVSFGDIPTLFVSSVVILMLGGQGKDSNLRYDLRRIAALASCCLKPLSHLSSTSYFTHLPYLLQYPRS